MTCMRQCHTTEAWMLSSVKRLDMEEVTYCLILLSQNMFYIGTTYPKNDICFPISIKFKVNQHSSFYVLFWSSSGQFFCLCTNLERNCHWCDLETFHIACVPPCGAHLPLNCTQTFPVPRFSIEQPLSPWCVKKCLFTKEVLLHNYSLSVEYLTYLMRALFTFPSLFRPYTSPPNPH